MAHYAIYVPGLGDHRTYGQNIFIQLWRLFGVRPRYVALGWNVAEGFAAKAERLQKEVAKYAAAGHQVSLVGVSAGASAVLNVYATSDHITHVVCISGKINNPQVIQPRIFTTNPDFKESMDRLPDSLAALDEGKRRKIMSTHPWRDQTVPITDTILPGAKEKTLPGWSHATGIILAIIFGSHAIGHFIVSKKG